MLTDTEFQIKKKAVLDDSGAAFFLSFIEGHSVNSIKLAN